MSKLRVPIGDITKSDDKKVEKKKTTKDDLEKEKDRLYEQLDKYTFLHRMSNFRIRDIKKALDSEVTNLYSDKCKSDTSCRAVQYKGHKCYLHHLAWKKKAECYYKTKTAFNYTSKKGEDYETITVLPNSIVGPHPAFDDTYILYQDSYMWAIEKDTDKRGLTKACIRVDLDKHFVENHWDFFEKVDKEKVIKYIREVEKKDKS